MKTPGNKQDNEKTSDVLWRAVSAPGFTLIVLGAWLVWLLLGTQVSQGGSVASVFGENRYGISEAIVNAGLHDALRSWVVGLLSLVTFLALIARVIRESSPGELAQVGAEVHLDAKTPPEVGRWIEGSLGIKRWGEDRGMIKGARGRLVEGALLVGIAIVMVLAGSAMGWNQVTGVLQFAAPEPGAEQWNLQKTLVRGPGGWSEAELHVGVQCESAQVPGPDQSFDCRVGTGEESFQGLVSVHNPLHTKWGVLRLRSFTRADNTLGAFGVASHVTPGEVVQRGIAGQSYQLRLPEENEFNQLRLRMHVTQGGQLATVESQKDDKVWLLSELPMESQEKPPVWIRSYGQAVWKMEWVANRSLVWFYACMIIGLLGTMLIAFVPHLRLEAVLREDGGYLVRLSSLNRPLLPGILCERAKSTPEES